MKKTLAESIREAMNLLGEAPVHMADALQDLHKESSGQPTLELAKEIASDYPGVNPERLMAEYPEWVRTQANKSASTSQVDPEKAAMAKRYQDNKDAEEKRKERELKRDRQKQDEEDRKQKHRTDNEEVYAAAAAELEKFKHLPGWNVREPDPYGFSSNDVCPAICIENEDGIHINLWASTTADWAKTPARWSIHGDVRFTANGGSFTYTRRGIDMDSFSYSQDEPVDPSTIIADQVKRVTASRQRLEGQVDVPGTHGIRVNKAEIPAIADEIRRGGTYTLAPVGMGIGYELSAEPRQWAREAPEEMKKFFGLDRLYIFQLDFD